MKIKRTIVALLLAFVCLMASACSLMPTNGKSAYELYCEKYSYTGTEEEWLASIQGKDGKDGENGQDGKSAYELYCEKYSYTGTEDEWLNDLLNGTLVQKEEVKPNLTISVMGASSSTKEGRNAVEVKIGQKDVGVQLKAYVTYYDYYLGKNVGGHRITASDVGKELTFVPTQADVGKTIGEPKNYNESSVKVWWEHVEDYFNCTVNPVCWSGSSYSSFQTKDTLATSYAWHDAQIRKLGIRVEGSMKREAPDIVILHRGINDMTKAPYARLTEGYFDNPEWRYPTTDVIGTDSDGNTLSGLQQALALTIKKIRAAYPNTIIVLSTITTMQRVNYGDFPTNNGYYTDAQLNAAIRETADFFGCQMIDFDKCGITIENGVKSGYLKTDRTHPTAKGHVLIGKQAINDLLYKVHLDVNDYLPKN